MLGISTADAIALGTLILAALAAWQGSRAGDASRRTRPDEPSGAPGGGTLVDPRTLRDLVEAVRSLDATLARAIEALEDERGAAFADTLRRLNEALEARKP